MNAIFTSLELDKEELLSKTICILNDDLCDSNFIINSFIHNSLRSNNSSLCLISFKKSFSHYNLIGSKSGLNLNASSETGSFIHIDVTKEMCDIMNQSNVNEFMRTFLFSEIISKVQNNIVSLSRKYDKIGVIVDSVSDIINCCGTVKDTIYFIYNLLLLSQTPKVSLVLGSQFCEEDPDKIIVKNYLMNCSNFRIIVSSLKTGFSSQVSGCLKYSKKDEDRISGWSLEQNHQFNVTDRNIKIFSPGAV